MKHLNFFKRDESYSVLFDNEWRRLKLLENAVTNYSGGIENLLERINKQTHSPQCLDFETFALLKDMGSYLRDIKIIIRDQNRDS